MDSKMRLLTFLAGWMGVSLAQAAGLGGTYVIEGQGGTIMARLEESGRNVQGYIDLAGKTQITLSGTVSGQTAHGRAASPEGAGEFDAMVEGDILHLTLSQKDGPGQRAATLPLLLRRSTAGSARQIPSDSPAKAPAAASTDTAGDSRLVGAWVHQNLISSGTASLAAEEYLILRADGTYRYGKGRAVAGGADWSRDGGTGGELGSGQWRARDRTLFIMGASGQWESIGRYAMTDDGSTVRITSSKGGHKLWNRR
jgi:hypothetical protein